MDEDKVEQPQEWTPEPVRKSDGTIWEGLSYIKLRDGFCLGSVNAEQAKALCAAHNAALDAAYEKGKQDGIRDETLP